PWDPSQTQNRDFIVNSVDKTASTMHFFLNLPSNLSDAQVVAMVGQSSQGSQYDRDQFKYGFAGVPSGNNVLTTVTYEITGNYSVQRFAGIELSTARGAGLGDLNYDGSYTASDVSGSFEPVLYSQNAQFNPAGDLNGDGK